MSTATHDHLWIDILQHTQRNFFLENNNKRVFKYRHELLLDACISGSSNAVRMLLAAGANVNRAYDYSASTALMWASYYNQLDVVPILIAAGANVDQEDDLGDTALMYASIYDNSDMVCTLIAAGADKNHMNKDGDTAQTHKQSYMTYKN